MLKAVHQLKRFHFKFFRSQCCYFSSTLLLLEKYSIVHISFYIYILHIISRQLTSVTLSSLFFWKHQPSTLLSICLRRITRSFKLSVLQVVVTWSLEFPSTKKHAPKKSTNMDGFGGLLPSKSHRYMFELLEQVLKYQQLMNSFRHMFILLSFLHLVLWTCKLFAVAQTASLKL